MSKLTEAQRRGLARMAANFDRYGTTMSEPNENTGRALERRGLVKVIGFSGKWARYEISEAGRRALQTGGGDGE